MSEHSDDDVRELLALAGPRTEPPDAARERVHQAVLEAWEKAPITAPESKHRRRWLALAASVVVGVAIGYLILGGIPEDAPGISGEILHATSGYSVHGSDEIDAPFLQEGSMLRTSSEGYLYIRLDEHTTLRLDHNTSITLETNSEVWLHRGRLYADSTGDGSIRVEALNASITDIGTQFEVAIDGDALEVAVREGRIEVVLLNDQAIAARAQSGVGERLTISGVDDVRRDTLATTDASWFWTHGAREAYDLDTGTLYDFLSWAARESGLVLRFESGAARMASNTTTPCCGDTTGFTPAQAISSVLDSSDFRALDGPDHELLIGFRR